MHDHVRKVPVSDWAPRLKTTNHQPWGPSRASFLHIPILSFFFGLVHFAACVEQRASIFGPALRSLRSRSQFEQETVRDQEIHPLSLPCLQLQLRRASNECSWKPHTLLGAQDRGDPPGRLSDQGRRWLMG